MDRLRRLRDLRIRRPRDPRQREASLSRFIEQLREGGDGWGRQALRRPAASLTAAHDLLRLPVLHATVRPDTVEGALLDQVLAQRHTRRRFLRHFSVLVLPERPGGYSEGSERQTLRRMVRKARARGITCVEVTDPLRQSDLIDIADGWERVDPDPRYSKADATNRNCLSYRRWLVAYDRAGHPVALAVTPVDGDVALLRYFRTIGAGSDQTLARYLMMQVLAEGLAADGVRYLVDEISPLRLPNGLRHFQRMVGFRLFRMRATTDRTPSDARAAHLSAPTTTALRSARPQLRGADGRSQAG